MIGAPAAAGRFLRRNLSAVAELELIHEGKETNMSLHDFSFDSTMALRTLNDWLCFERYEERLAPSAFEDELRGLLVGQGSLGCPALEHATLAAIRDPVKPVWALLALRAVLDRARGDEDGERLWLLEAIRRAPDELSLFLALGRLEWGTGSPLEVFAIRRALDLAYYWPAGEARLDAAAVEAGEDLGPFVDPEDDFLGEDVDWHDSDEPEDWGGEWRSAA